MSDGSSRTAFVLLAAGNSSRMGSAKQMLDFRGQPLLRHAASVAAASGCDPVVVVLGARAEALRPVLDGLPVTIVVNERWEEGVGTSIQAGLRVASEYSPITGAVLGLADQPLVTAAYLAGLVAQHEQTRRAIVASRYAGTVGVPAYFARNAFPLLMALEPDKGCKGVIVGHPDDTYLVDCRDAAYDLDTPDDYRSVSTKL